MRNVFGWSLVVSGCLAGAALSQNVPKTERPPAAPTRPGGAVAPPERGGRPAAAALDQAPASSDQQIAACIYIGCRNHIAMAEFAQSRLTNPEAKQFAEKMASDHGPGCEKMRELAGSLVSGRAWEAGDRAAPGPEAAPRATPAPRPGLKTNDGVRVPAAGTPAEARREERQERRDERREAIRDTARKGVEVDVQPGAPGGVAVRTGGVAGGPFSWVNIHKEIADRCLATFKKEFGELPGAELDKVYMAHEVMVHLKTIDELSVLKNHASPNLQSDIDKSIQMAQNHLIEAKQIKEQLKGSEGEPRLSRQPGKATTPSTTPRAVPKQE